MKAAIRCPHCDLAGKPISVRRRRAVEVPGQNKLARRYACTFGHTWITFESPPTTDEMLDVIEATLLQP